MEVEEEAPCSSLILRIFYAILILRFIPTLDPTCILYSFPHACDVVCRDNSSPRSDCTMLLTLSKRLRALNLEPACCELAALERACDSRGRLLEVFDAIPSVICFVRNPYRSTDQRAGLYLGCKDGKK